MSWHKRLPQVVRHFSRYGISRYVMVGVVATAAHYLLLAACVEFLAWPAWFASGAGAVVGAQVAFFGNRRFTFAHHGALWPAWLRFQTTAMAGTALGMAVVAGAVATGWHYLPAQVLATLIAMLLTFTVNRTWTFR